MKDYVVFSIGSNKQLAKDFAKFWNCQLGKISVKRFSDGEVSIKPITDVKDKDVIVIESTAKKPHDHIFEILLFLDSLNGSQVKSITLIIPYLAYARKQRASDPNEPIGYQVMTRVLETGKYNKLMTFDLHHPEIETSFTRGMKNVSTTEIFVNYYNNYLREHKYKGSNVVVVSPNRSSNIRADSIMFRINGSKRASVEKDKGETGIKIKGDVQNKVCIIADDIISTGNTIAKTTKALLKAGAKEVLVAATHGAFVGDAISLIKESGVKDIAITNTIEQGKIEGVTILDVLPLIIENI